MKFASAVNNAGAADTFTLRNVPDSTTIKLYLRDGESYRQIASKPGSGTVSFTGLDFGSGAGRVYYTATTGDCAESIKLSTAFAAEEGAAYNVSVFQPENGTVAANLASAKAGDTVKLTATPADGYELDCFLVNGEKINGSSFTMPEGDVTVTAMFRKTQELENNLALNAKIMGYNKTYRNFKETGPCRLFDGDENKKWTASGTNGWVAFDIGSAADIKTMKLFHAGSAGEDSKLNTASYELYVLNENLITEENFAKLSAPEQSRLCAIPRYWTKVVVKTDNTEDITGDNVELDHARRYFKFNARKTNSIGRSYSVNIYELQLFA